MLKRDSRLRFAFFISFEIITIFSLVPYIIARERKLKALLFFVCITSFPPFLVKVDSTFPQTVPRFILCPFFPHSRFLIPFFWFLFSLCQPGSPPCRSSPGVQRSGVLLSLSFLSVLSFTNQHIVSINLQPPWKEMRLQGGRKLYCQVLTNSCCQPGVLWN